VEIAEVFEEASDPGSGDVGAGAVDVVVEGDEVVAEAEDREEARKATRSGYR